MVPSLYPHRNDERYVRSRSYTPLKRRRRPQTESTCDVRKRPPLEQCGRQCSHIDSDGDICMNPCNRPWQHRNAGWRCLCRSHGVVLYDLNGEVQADMMSRPRCHPCRSSHHPTLTLSEVVLHRLLNFSCKSNMVWCQQSSLIAYPWFPDIR